MKKIIALGLILVVTSVFAVEEKKVCIDKVGKDGKALIGKDGKVQQECKTIKIHKKLDVNPNTEKK